MCGAQRRTTRCRTDGGDAGHHPPYAVASGGAQEGYASDLLGTASRFDWEGRLDFDGLRESARVSGGELLLLVEARSFPQSTNRKEGYAFKPWLVMVQVINHATEHREQIKSMLGSPGLEPPRTDGWGYGPVSGALIKEETNRNR